MDRGGMPCPALADAIATARDDVQGRLRVETLQPFGHDAQRTATTLVLSVTCVAPLVTTHSFAKSADEWGTRKEGFAAILFCRTAPSRRP
jgi:hypothetical protein